jgi:hypothetical protein
VCNQFPLDLRDEITMVIIDYEPHWTIAPLGSSIEFRKPFAMVLVGRIEDHIGPAM